jgi:hypothetical protein
LLCCAVLYCAVLCRHWYPCWTVTFRGPCIQQMSKGRVSSAFRTSPPPPSVVPACCEECS